MTPEAVVWAPNVSSMAVGGEPGVKRSGAGGYESTGGMSADRIRGDGFNRDGSGTVGGCE